ncbi:MAG: diaminohydroxyphosphoribosylaminopyrimidine deaminase, partial [Candidatus Deianiraeaceae bacterium]
LGIDCHGAELFVTLEPCAHHGKTFPCVENIIDAGITKVTIGMQDLDTRVNGRGIETLRAKGVEVELLEMDEIREFYRHYIVYKTQLRPYITLKIASSMDGKIALLNGKSKWITSHKVRYYTNFLRSRFNGIMVGAETVRKDNPSLNCRIVGLEKFSPRKIVASSTKISEYITVNGSVTEMLETLHRQGVQSLLVEGGANVITQFIKSNIFDEIIVVQAPIFLGNDAKNYIDDMQLQDIPLHSMQIQERKIIDGNIVLILKNL